MKERAVPRFSKKEEEELWGILKEFSRRRKALIEKILEEITANPNFNRQQAENLKLQFLLVLDNCSDFIRGGFQRHIFLDKLDTMIRYFEKAKEDDLRELGQLLVNFLDILWDVRERHQRSRKRS